MASGLRIIPMPMLSIDSATFTGSYQALTAIPFAACLVKFVNNSNALATVSWDGITDHDILPGGSFSLYDINTNAGTSRGLWVPQGTIFRVKGAASVSNAGLFYVVSFTTSEY